MTVQPSDESVSAPNFRRTSLRGRGAALQLRAQQQQEPLKPVLIGKTPEADFSQEAMERREYVTRRVEGQNLRVALEKQARPMEFVPGTSREPEVIRAVQNRFDKEVADLIAASQERVRQRNLADFPILQEYLNNARNAGQPISERDVENVVSWGQLNAAVDLYVKAADAGDALTMNNIVATLSDQDTGNLEMATMFPTLVEERLAAVASQALADPNIVDKALAGIGTVAYNAFNVLFYPASKFNEAQRATEYYQENERPGGVLGFLQGATQYLPYMSQLSTALPSAVFNPEATRRTGTPGSFNTNYLSQLVTAGGYSQREVNLATEIARRFAVGDADPIVSVWNEQGDMLDPEVAGFFYNLMSNADNDDTRRVQDLMRQIQSVDMGNNGAIRLGAADPNLEYNPDRATKWFEYTKGAADISMQVASDPLMFLGPAMRAAQVAKWQIGRLMPGAEKAVDVLKPRTIRGVTVHTRASRYFDNLVKDLNELDGLEEAAKAATGKKQAALRKRATLARQRMSGRYNNIPEDLLETFRTSVPKNEQGQRTLEGLAQFIDSANVAWETAAGKVAREVVAEGATDIASRSVTSQLMETKAFQKFIADNPTIAGQMASRSQRRNLLIPQMGIIGGVRSRAINKIVVNSLPFGQATKIIDDFFGNAQTPQEIADVIEGRFVELARAKQPLTPAGIYDRFTRTFTSLPNDVVISIDTASSAKDFYRYTRQFLDKGTAAFLTDAFRTASPAARRALVISVVRSSFAARGVVLKPSQLDEMISRPTGAPVGPEEARISGINPGEAFEAVIDGPMPSDRLGIFREQKAAMARATTPVGEQQRLPQASAFSVQEKKSSLDQWIERRIERSIFGRSSYQKKKDVIRSDPNYPSVKFWRDEAEEISTNPAGPTATSARIVDGIFENASTVSRDEYIDSVLYLYPNSTRELAERNADLIFDENGVLKSVFGLNDRTLRDGTIPFSNSVLHTSRDVMSRNIQGQLSEVLVLRSLRAAHMQIAPKTSFDDFVKKLKENSVQADEVANTAEAKIASMDKDFIRQVNEVFFREAYGLGPDDTVRLYRFKTGSLADGPVVEGRGYYTLDPDLARSFDVAKGEKSLLAIDIPIKDLPHVYGISGYYDELAVFIPRSANLRAKVLAQKIDGLDAERNLAYKITPVNVPRSALPKGSEAAAIAEELRKKRIIEWFPDEQVIRVNQEFLERIETLENIGDLLRLEELVGPLLNRRGVPYSFSGKPLDGAGGATARPLSQSMRSEIDLVRSAETVDDFVEKQPGFDELYGELETLTLQNADALEIQALNQRFTEWYATQTSRYWQLKNIADIEDSIKEIEDALPAFRQTASGPDWIMADDVFEQEVLREMDEVRRLLDEDLQFAVGDFEIVDIGQLIGLMTTQTGKGLNLPPQWMSVYERSGEIPFWWVERAWNANIGQSKASNILRQWLRTGKTEIRDVDDVELNFGLPELRDEAYPYVNMRGKETKTKVLRLPWKAERSEDAVRARAEALVEDSWFNQAAPQFDLMYDSLLKLRDDYADAVANLTDDAIRQEATERVIGNLPMRSNPIDPIAAVSDDIARAEANRPWSPSRDRFGVEHAMHEYQIAENIRIPSAKELDDLRQGALARRLGKVNNGIGRIVDYWSWGTLFGPRFSMRNAIEEIGIYFLTGGRFMDLYRGRKADTAMREITPTWQVKKVDGKLELVPRSELGMVASRMRRVGTKLQARREHANQEWLADIILPNVDQDRLLEATIAFQAGDVNAYSDLLTETIIQLDRGVGLTALSPREKRALSSLAKSNHGLTLMDDVAAGGSAILSGRYPQLARTAIDLEVVEPGVVEAVMGRIPMAGPALKWGEYKGISPLAKTPEGRMFGNWWWFRGLQAVVDGDGPIGKLAVLHLGDPKKAKEAIFDAVKNDTTWGYKKRWTRLANATDDDILEFANSYYETALRLFQKKNGDINWDLRKKFIDKDADGNTIVMWRKTRNPDGTPIPGITGDEYMLRVNSRYLAGLKEDDVPEVILGRELAAAQQPIPVAGSIDGLFSLMDNIVDGGYGWMGRQNARISRGPLFKANYFNMVKQMQPFEDDLVKAIAGGGEVTPQHRKLAEMLTDSISMDSAYNMTMAYLDNPANRSALAWRARNVARYYRATEDFYRRAGRIAKFYPDAYYRAALTYSLLDTTGFVYTDDEGNKYFAYPGNEIVQDVIANVANPFFGLPFMGTQRVDPFFLGGKVLGLSPSLDPKMAFPSMMGPLTVPLVAVFDMFPNLLGLKAALLGPYAATGAGTLWDDVKNAALPAGAKRLFAVLDEEELETILGQAAVDTVKIMVAEGIIEANGDSVSDFMQSDAYKEAQSISVGLVFTKAVMGWLAPGAPQVYDNNVSNIARRMGITSMDSAFRKILEARVAAGDEDAWNTATSMWYAAKIPGSKASTQYSPWNSIMPFTIGGTRQADTIAAGAGVQPYDTVYEWFERGEGKRLLGLKGGPDAVGWLAPREGEFTWQAWNLVKNVRGYRVSKTTEQGLEDIFSAEGKYKEMEIRRYYGGEIEKLDPNIPEQMERIKQLNKEKDFLLIDNERKNPYWSKVKVDERAEDNQAILRSRLTSMETLLGSMEQEGIKIQGAALHIQNAITIWRTFSPMIDGLGRSRTDLAAKAALRAQMEAALLEEASQSVNAENFINGVINPLNYGSLRDPYELEQ